MNIEGINAKRIPVGGTDALPEMPDEKELSAVVGAGLSSILGGKAIDSVSEKSGGDADLEIPLIDDPNYKITLKIDAARMALIVSVESDAEQMKHLREVIKSDQGSIKAQCAKRLKKVEDTLKKMDDAARASIFNKIFGWLMVAVAVISAVALSIVSGGLALGPVIGATLALTFQVLNETEVTEKIIKGIAESIQDDFGCDKATAQMWATIIWTALQLTACLVGGFGGNAIASAAQNGANAATTILRTAGMAFQKLSETAQKVMLITQALGLLGAGAGMTWSTVANYRSGLSQSKVTLFEALIRILQQRLEEDEDAIHQLMQLLNGSSVKLLKLLGSAIDAQRQISENLGHAFSYS